MSVGGGNDRWVSVHEPAWDANAGDPWDRPLGSPVPEGVDPPHLPGATPFFAYMVEENDLHFTIFVDHVGHPRLFVAEEPDAIHVVAVEEPRRSRNDGVAEGGALMDFGPHELHGMVKRPIDGRPIIDATRGVAAKRLPKPPTSDDLRRMDPEKPHWQQPKRGLRRRRPRT